MNDTEKDCTNCKFEGARFYEQPCPSCEDASNWKPVQVMPIQGNDSVNHPKHYTNHPSGIECIQITEHMGFNLGNAIKYIWRADLKADAIEDMKKAVWYIQREIAKREGK
jgi:hypothetical protein